MKLVYKAKFKKKTLDFKLSENQNTQKFHGSPEKLSCDELSMYIA